MLAGADHPFAETAAAPDAHANHEGARVTVLDNRVEVVRPVRTHEGKPIGSVVVHLSLAAENAAYAATLHRMLRLGVLTGAGMLSLLLLLVRRQILVPLDGLALAAGRVGRGDKGVLLDVRSNDEIGRLNRAFNAMSEAITDRETRLFTANKSLEELFDNMREGIVVFARDGRVTGASSRQAAALFARMEGEAKSLEGRLIVDLLYPEAFDGDPEAAALGTSDRPRLPDPSAPLARGRRASRPKRSCSSPASPRSACSSSRSGRSPPATEPAA